MDDLFDRDVIEPRGRSLSDAVGLQMTQSLCPLQNLHLLHGQPQEGAAIALGIMFDQVVQALLVFFWNRKAYRD